ncbi:hypothetical protein ACIQWR_36825 [Streptomyces sp. NPDC098789]|uniref:hypothetical protein n=1 Tax=Streptomyces sp. NPDC098789 TaxID=3366098 RepID=UPI003811B995
MSFIRKAAVVAASMIAATAAAVMPASAATAASPGCEVQVSSNQHMAQTRCYDIGYTHYAVRVTVCDGRACAERTGPWRKTNSGEWSRLEDNATWILEGKVVYANK